MSANLANMMEMDRDGLEAYFASIGEKPFRATQIMNWMYQRDVMRFDEMTNLSKALRSSLDQNCEICLPEILSDRQSKDGTRKWLLKVPGKSAIETVFIPEKKRGTLCISSQIGCALDCAFCATGKQGFDRDLNTAEIIAQLSLANSALSHSKPANRRTITNVVLMGMGEPLLNFDNVVRAMRIMLDDHGFGLSKRRVTLSTAGLVPRINQLKQECPVSLAVSLHAANDELRNTLVPLNKKYPLRQLIESCRQYVDGSRRASITFEYIMLAGINDRQEDAKDLVSLLRDLPCKINLIPYNTVTGLSYSRPTLDTIEGFRDILHKNKMRVTIRRTRGSDIDAACGQLAGRVADKTLRSERFRNKVKQYG